MQIKTIYYMKGNKNNDTKEGMRRSGDAYDIGKVRRRLYD